MNIDDNGIIKALEQAGKASETIAIWITAGIVTILLVMIAPVVWAWCLSHWSNIALTVFVIALALGKATWSWK